MKNTTFFLSVLAAALFGSGCVMPNTGKEPEIWWSTLNPSDDTPSKNVRDFGPYAVFYCPSLGIVNLDENYNGNDSPWIDRTDDFRMRVADALNGYDPSSITLGDVAWARNNFLCKRLGNDYALKDYGRNDEEIVLAAGKKWDSINKYGVLNSMFPSLFQRANNSTCKVTITVVSDAYRARSGKVSPVFDMSIYLESLTDDNTLPVPKTVFTKVKDQTAKMLAVEGTERDVSGVPTMDIETPRGRYTVYRYSGADAEVRMVGLAVMKLLDSLPEGRIRQLRNQKN